MKKEKALSERSSLTIQEVLDKMNHQFYAGLKCGRQELAEAVSQLKEGMNKIRMSNHLLLKKIELYVQLQEELGTEDDKIFGSFDNHSPAVKQDSPQSGLKSVKEVEPTPEDNHVCECGHKINRHWRDGWCFGCGKFCKKFTPKITGKEFGDKLKKAGLKSSDFTPKKKGCGVPYNCDKCGEDFLVSLCPECDEVGK